MSDFEEQIRFMPNRYQQEYLQFCKVYLESQNGENGYKLLKSMFYQDKLKALVDSILNLLHKSSVSELAHLLELEFLLDELNLRVRSCRCYIDLNQYLGGILVGLLLYDKFKKNGFMEEPNIDEMRLYYTDDLSLYLALLEFKLNSLAPFYMDIFLDSFLEECITTKQKELQQRDLSKLVRPHNVKMFFKVFNKYKHILKRQQMLMVLPECFKELTDKEKKKKLCNYFFDGLPKNEKLWYIEEKVQDLRQGNFNQNIQLFFHIYKQYVRDLGIESQAYFINALVTDMKHQDKDIVNISLLYDEFKSVLNEESLVWVLSQMIKNCA